MIFEETEWGLSIHIAHDDVIEMPIGRFFDEIMMGREIYRSHHDADLDDDHSDGERYRSRNLDVVILESSHRYQTVY